MTEHYGKNYLPVYFTKQIIYLIKTFITGPHGATVLD